MGPIWGRQDPGGSHVGPMDFVSWGVILKLSFQITGCPQVSFCIRGHVLTEMCIRVKRTNTSTSWQSLLNVRLSVWNRYSIKHEHWFGGGGAFCFGHIILIEFRRSIYPDPSGFFGSLGAITWSKWNIRIGNRCTKYINQLKIYLGVANKKSVWSPEYKSSNLYRYDWMGLGMHTTKHDKAHIVCIFFLNVLNGLHWFNHSFTYHWSLVWLAVSVYLCLELILIIHSGVALRNNTSAPLPVAWISFRQINDPYEVLNLLFERNQDGIPRQTSYWWLVFMC